MALAHVTLSETQGYAILVAPLGFLGMGFLTRRAAAALLPLLGGATFLGATIVSDDLYSRIPEDVQMTILAACMLGIPAALIGVVLRRILDSERDRRIASG